MTKWARGPTEAEQSRCLHLHGMQLDKLSMSPFWAISARAIATRIDLRLLRAGAQEQRVGGYGPQNYGSAGEERRVGKLTWAGKWQKGYWAMAEVVCDTFGIACLRDIGGGRTRGEGLLGTRVKTFLGCLGLAGFKLVIG